MSIEISELDRMQSNYKAAVEEWIAALRNEEALASVDHAVSQIDQWENARTHEKKLKPQKRNMKDVLRQEFF